jgi:predicted transposase/invertase (TIGR01784 family)
MANQVLNSISRDEEERARIMRDEKILLDYYSGINYAKRTGHEEGMQEKSIQVARNALAEGSTIEFVQKITGLSREDIINL